MIVTTITTGSPYMRNKVPEPKPVAVAVKESLSETDLELTFMLKHQEVFDSVDHRSRYAHVTFTRIASIVRAVNDAEFGERAAALKVAIRLLHLV